MQSTTKHITEDFDFNKVKKQHIEDDYRTLFDYFLSISDLYDGLKHFKEPADFIKFYFNKINKSRLNELLIKLINDKDLNQLLEVSYKDIEINQSYITYTLVDISDDDYIKLVVKNHGDDLDFIVLCGLLVVSFELGLMMQFEDALNSDEREAYIYAISLEGPRKGGGNFTYWEYKFIDDNDKFKADYDEVLYDTFYDRFNDEIMDMLIDYIGDDYNILDEDFNFDKVKSDRIEDDYEINRYIILKNIPASITPIDVLYKKYGIHIDYYVQHHSDKFGYYQGYEYSYSYSNNTTNPHVQLLNKQMNALNFDRHEFNADNLENSDYLNINELPEYILDFINDEVGPRIAKFIKSKEFNLDIIKGIIFHVTPDSGIFIITLIEFYDKQGMFTVPKFLKDPIFVFTGDVLYNDDTLNEDFDFNTVKGHNIQDDYEISIKDFNKWKSIVANNRSYKQQVEWVYSNIDIKKIPIYLQNIANGVGNDIKPISRINVVQMSPEHSEYRIWYDFNSICEYITDIPTLLFAGLLQNIVSIHLIGEIDIEWTDSIDKENNDYPVSIENTWLNNVELVFDLENIVLNDYNVHKGSDNTTSEYLYNAFYDIFDTITCTECDEYSDDLIKYLKDNESDEDYYSAIMNEDFDFNKVKKHHIEDDYIVDDVSLLDEDTAIQNYIKLHGADMYNKAVIEYVGPENLWHAIYNVVQTAWEYYDCCICRDDSKYGEEYVDYDDIYKFTLNVQTKPYKNMCDDFDYENIPCLILGMLTYTAYVQITGEYEVVSGDEWNSTKLCTESYQIHNVKLFNNDNELLSEAKYNDIVELRDVLSSGPVDGYLMDAYNGEIF